MSNDNKPSIHARSYWDRNCSTLNPWAIIANQQTIFATQYWDPTGSHESWIHCSLAWYLASSRRETILLEQRVSPVRIVVAIIVNVRWIVANTRDYLVPEQKSRVTDNDGIVAGDQQPSDNARSSHHPCRRFPRITALNYGKLRIDYPTCEIVNIAAACYYRCTMKYVFITQPF